MCENLKRAGQRFPSVASLIGRLEQRAAAALEDRARFRQFNEFHKEACVALELLKAAIVVKLDYEPAIRGCDKRLDFRVTVQGDREAWVEVKTIHPTQQDDWGKFEAARENGRFPRNVDVILAKEMMGGEIYHNHYSGRTKILEDVVETEAKLAECGIDPAATPCTLAVAASPLELPMDALEDFTFFYRTGKHSPWDEFRRMEAYGIAERQIQLRRTISKFAYVGRATYEIWPREVNWNVQHPTKWVEDS
jgi:hypothetical protein